MTFGKIGVVSSGMMGSEIALVFALAGHKVLLGDQAKNLAEAAIGKLQTLLAKGVARRFYSESEAAAALSNLSAAENGVINKLTLDVQRILHEAYGERFLPRSALKQMVAAGYDGRHSGRGRYNYGVDGKRLEDPA
jgi:3-hydroxyacyl-CoA dehydrogenase